jgi:hypothetical protein
MGVKNKNVKFLENILAGPVSIRIEASTENVRGCNVRKPPYDEGENFKNIFFVLLQKQPEWVLCS